MKTITIDKHTFMSKDQWLNFLDSLGINYPERDTIESVCVNTDEVLVLHTVKSQIEPVHLPV